MALTESKMLPLGTKAPKFSLPNVVNKKENRSTNLAGLKVQLSSLCATIVPMWFILSTTLLLLLKRTKRKGFKPLQYLAMM